jgi:hypothetical protein
MSVIKRKDLLLKSLLSFYKDVNHMKTLTNIVNNKSNVSLRIVDFLCTNYAKKQNAIYYINKTPFNLYLNYRGQLKAYSKIQFDPFRRHERITIQCPCTETKKFETTIAQLNFFKWAIENKVLDYLITNIKLIEKEMTKKTTKKKSEPKVVKCIHRHDVHLFVSFK